MCLEVTGLPKKHKEAFVEVTVISPFQKERVGGASQRKLAAARYAENAKRGKYAEFLAKQTGKSFYVAAMETTGAFGGGLNQLLNITNPVGPLQEIVSRQRSSELPFGCNPIQCRSLATTTTESLGTWTIPLRSIARLSPTRLLALLLLILPLLALLLLYLLLLSRRRFFRLSVRTLRFSLS